MESLALDAAARAARPHGMGARAFKRSVVAVTETVYGWSVAYRTRLSGGHVDVDKDYRVMPTSVWDAIHSRSMLSWLAVVVVLVPVFKLWAALEHGGYAHGRDLLAFAAVILQFLCALLGALSAGWCVSHHLLSREARNATFLWTALPFIFIAAIVFLQS